jgi:hypothetical protein
MSSFVVQALATTEARAEKAEERNRDLAQQVQQSTTTIEQLREEHLQILAAEAERAQKAAEEHAHALAAAEACNEQLALARSAAETRLANAEEEHAQSLANAKAHTKQLRTKPTLASRHCRPS